jgi:hypothetical protein
VIKWRAIVDSPHSRLVFSGDEIIIKSGDGLMLIALERANPK